MPRFSGRPSFMKLPWWGTDMDGSVAVIGVPFDGGTTFQSGARMGPWAIRQASWGLYPYSRAHRISLADARLADAGDLRVVPMSVPDTLMLVEHQLRVFPGGTRFLALGGDHSITLGLLRDVARRWGPVGLIHFDAHSDLWDELWGQRYNHATVFRRAWEEGLILPERTIQVGIRGSLDHPDEDGEADRLGILQVSTDTWLSQGTRATIDQIRNRVGRGPVYLSVDLDVVDPAYVPGTGTPEAGGPSSHMLLSVLRGLAGLSFVGADVVELAPPLDPTIVSGLVAATVAQEALFLLTLAP